uniref:Uncharacterized protein n=1 Tax=Populus trichocarpa TaxID=3694 RepID=A0A3N7EVF6_POPTR
MLFFCLSHTNPVSLTIPHSTISCKGKRPFGKPTSLSNS